MNLPIYIQQHTYYIDKCMRTVECKLCYNNLNNMSGTLVRQYRAERSCEPGFISTSLCYAKYYLFSVTYIGGRYVIKRLR